MTRWFSRDRGDDRWDAADVDPAVTGLVEAARDTSGAVDTATLESTLAAFRVAGEQAAPVPAPEPEPAAPRRHRVLRALAATTVATKVVLGVATAAALGGIGVAVNETVHHLPRPAPTTTAPVTPPSTGDTDSDDGGGNSPSPTTSPTSTASPTMTVTDTASAGANSSTPSSATPTSTRGTPTTSATRSTSPSRSASPSRSSSTTQGVAAPSGSPTSDQTR